MKEDVKGRIIAERSGHVMHIRISNPARYNAMSLAMWEELASAVKATDQDDEIRAIVLSGEGRRAFASGADITEFKSQREDAAQSARYSAAVAAAQEALSTNRHPTIALIRGICMGGGMALAIACDVRYCLDDSRFRMPAGRLGLGYALEGMRRFVNIIGAAASAELFFTAKTFDGREAQRIGLVQESFTAESFDAITTKRIDALVNLAPLTLRAAKLELRHVLKECGAPDEAQVEAAIQACYNSDDYQEGQKAFLEKRPPRFFGR